MRPIVRAVSAAAILLLSTVAGASIPASVEQPSAPTYAIGDTVYVADGEPLPEAPEGTQWVATGLMIETFPVLHEYVLKAISDPTDPVESPSKITLMVGSMLPDPPVGMDYVLTGLLETFPAQYQFELAPGNPSFETFSGMFNVIGAFAQEAVIVEADVQFLLDMARADGEVQGHEHQALADTLLVLDPILTAEAKALLQRFLRNH